MKCASCDKEITYDEIIRTGKFCFECNMNKAIETIAYHMREAHITFEEMIRKLIIEVDK